MRITTSQTDKAVKRLLLFIESMDLSVDEFIEWMKNQKVKK